MTIRFLKFKVFLKYCLLFTILIFPLASVSANINLQGQLPQVQFESTRYDFGDIYQGQVTAHQFKFQNTGNGVLVLTSLHASCGCVNARALAENGSTPKNIFRPGEKGMIAVEFNSNQFAGKIIRTVTVETNADDKESTATLSLLANVHQEIVTNPALLYIGKISKASRNIYNIRMNITDPNIKILDIESDLPFISASLVPNKSNPKLFQIVVSLKETKSLPIGPFRGSLFIKNSSAYYKSLKVPVMGEVIGHVQSSTKFVEFGVVNSNRTQNRDLKFTSTEKDFAIKNVKIDLKPLDSLQKIKKDDLFEVVNNSRTFKKNGEFINEYNLSLTLKYPKDLSKKSKTALLTGVNVSGNLIIETNDPDYTEVKVPFFGVLKHE